MSIGDAAVVSAEGGAYFLGAEFQNFGALRADGTALLLERYAGTAALRSWLHRAKARGWRYQRTEFVTPEELAEAYRDPSLATASALVAPSAMERLWGEMLHEAEERRASDIHIECGDGATDGVGGGATVDFREQGQMVTKRPLAASEAKVLLYSVYQRSDTQDPTYLEHRIQTGRMATGDKITLPASIGSLRMIWTPLGPSSRGRYLAARIHYQEAMGAASVDEMPFTEQAKAALRRATRRPCGLILTTGPLGSGKTTLQRKKMQHKWLTGRGRPNVITVEDPVEFKILWARQISMPHSDEEREVQYGELVAAALRMDFDWGMVGEIRDAVTASSVVEVAGEIGRPLFSTAHMDSIEDCVGRFRGLHVEKYRLVNPKTWSLITNCRLVPMLCPSCALRIDEARPRLGDELLETMIERRIDLAALRFRKPGGCPRCDNDGSKGRIQIIECLEPDERILRMMYDENVERRAIRAYWQRNLGGVPLIEDGMRHVAAGIVAADELELICGSLERDGSGTEPGPTATPKAVIAL